MSERYKTVYSAEKDQYTPGSPVIITEGGLVRDIKNGNMLCQFKLVNISAKTVKRIVCRAVTDIGTAEGMADDLFCARDMEFSVNIPLEGFEHKRVRLDVKEIVFTDMSKWLPDEAARWSVISKPETLEDYLSDGDLIREFKSRFEEGKYFPLEEGDIWYCTCRALNHTDEGACHSCNRTLASLKKYGVTELKNVVAKQKRLDAINKDAFEEAYKQVLVDQKARRNRGMLYILIAAAVVTVIALLIASDNNHYTTAIEVFDHISKI